MQSKEKMSKWKQTRTEQDHTAVWPYSSSQLGSSGTLAILQVTWPHSRASDLATLCWKESQLMWRQLPVWEPHVGPQWLAVLWGNGPRAAAAASSTYTKCSRWGLIPELKPSLAAEDMLFPICSVILMS